MPCRHWRTARSDPAFPDRSATLLTEVASLADGDTLTLRGPGIETTQVLRVAGLPADFRAGWRANTPASRLAWTCCWPAATNSAP